MKNATTPRLSHAGLSRRSLWNRLLISLCCSVLISVLLPLNAHIYVRVLLAWDLGILIFMGLLWPVVQYDDPKTDAFQRRSVSRRMLVVLVTVLALSLMAIGGMLMDQSVPRPQRVSLMALSVLAVAANWLLTHITFAFRYAYEYYRNLAEAPSSLPLIDFEGGPAGYWDFLYMSFQVGNTFGVTDTGVRSTKMRVLVLVHSIVAFWFNTVLLALMLNAVSALL